MHAQTHTHFTKHKYIQAQWNYMKRHIEKRDKHTQSFFAGDCFPSSAVESGFLWHQPRGEERTHTHTHTHTKSFTLSGMPRPVWPCRSYKASWSQTFPNRHDIPTSHHQKTPLTDRCGNVVGICHGIYRVETHLCMHTIPSHRLMGSSMGTWHFCSLVNLSFSVIFTCMPAKYFSLKEIE